MDEIISVNVRMNHVTRMVEFVQSELNAKNIVSKLFAAFKTDPADYTSFGFANNLHAPVYAERLPHLLLEKRGSGSFFIEILLEKPSLCLKAEGIRNYLLDKGYASIISEYGLINDLSKQSRKQLTDAMFNFIKETLPDIKNEKDVNEVCQALIELFPLLSIDEIYNPKRKKGTIYHRIKNAIAVSKPLLGNPITTEAELIEYLKFCVVKKDKPKLKEKLGETIELRRKLLKANNDDFKEFMTFYFVDPELILYDYGLLFKDIDGNALHNKWEDLLSKPLSEWKENINMKIVLAKDEYIWKFFMLYDKFKPSRPANFYTAVTSLIIFSEDPLVEPMTLRNAKNHHPYLIGVLSVDKKKIKCYIDVHKYLVSVPENFALVDVVDLLYKIHKVFDLDFNPNIKHLMNF